MAAPINSECRPYLFGTKPRANFRSDQVLTNWFKLRARVEGVWPSFFSGSAGDMLESRFLTLMAFAEGYHRAGRDCPPLTEAQERDGVKQSQTR